MREEWREIEGYSMYLISNYGRVWSKTRVVVANASGKKTIKKGKFLKDKFDKDGYIYRDLYKEGESRSKKFRAHRLVAYAFLPTEEGKDIVNHIDGIKTNNNICNLEWVTTQENTKHAVKNGLRAIGERHGGSKFKDSDIIEMRKFFKENDMTYKELGKIYDIDQKQAWNIINRKIWKHI